MAVAEAVEGAVPEATELAPPRRKDWTSVGRALYHDGVWPAANWDAIWAETASELVKAS